VPFIRLTILVLIFSWFLLNTARTQTELREKNITLDSFFQKIPDHLPYSISYADHIIPPQKIPDLTIRLNQLWKKDFRAILAAQNLAFKILGNNILVYPLQRYLLQGYILDKTSREHLPGAHIYLPGLESGAVTNGHGFYQMWIPEGHNTMQISYLGYQTKNLVLDVDSSFFLSIPLVPHVDLPPILITDSIMAENQPFNQEILHQLSSSRLSAFPSLGGSLDLVRYVQFLPGVSTGADGFGGLHVRGGGSDQNLYLIDDTPIYNPFHMLGVVSIFNHDVVQEGSFSPGNFSAEYGDKTASILDIRLRDGKKDRSQVSGSVGILGSHLVLESPIFKKKGSLMIAGQRSHAGSIIKAYSKSQKKFGDVDGFAQLNYTDLYAKTSIQLGSTDKLIINGYWGQDQFSDVDKYNYIDKDTMFTDHFQDDFQWGNFAASAKWNHAFGKKVFSNITGYFSSYRYQSINAEISEIEQQDGPQFDFAEKTEFRSRIQDIGLKADFSFLPGPYHDIKAGLGFKNLQFIPGIIAYEEDHPNIPYPLGEEKLKSLPDHLFDDLRFDSRLLQVYIQEVWQFSSQVSLRLGLHTSLSLIDSFQYFSVQPRIALSWDPNPIAQIQFSFSQMQQAQHLITVTDNGYPNELWVPASALFRPQSSQQWEMKYATLLKGRGHYTLAAYYKKMNHLVHFKEDPGYLSFGSLDNLDASIWEEDLTSGEGEAYGIEQLFQYETQNLFSQLGYTWSRSWRTFNEKFQGQKIPYEYDRPHQLSILIQWAVSGKFTLGLAWQLASGTNLTLPSGAYEVTDFSNELLDYFTVPTDQIETLRLPTYHRLDLSLEYRFGKPFRQQIKMNLVNIYDRINTPYATIYNDPEVSTIFLSTGLPIVPSLAYHFRF
jgi:hypothetical protein